MEVTMAKVTMLQEVRKTRQRAQAANTMAYDAKILNGELGEKMLELAVIMADRDAKKEVMRNA